MNSESRTVDQQLVVRVIAVLRTKAEKMLGPLTERESDLLAVVVVDTALIVSGEFDLDAWEAADGLE